MRVFKAGRPQTKGDITQVGPGGRASGGEMDYPGSKVPQSGTEASYTEGRMTHFGAETRYPEGRSQSGPENLYSGTGMMASKLDGSLFRRSMGTSVPLTTQAFARGATGANAMELFTPPSTAPARLPPAAVSLKRI